VALQNAGDVNLHLASFACSGCVLRPLRKAADVNLHVVVSCGLTKIMGDTRAY
jgi:hypothetical protein